MFAIEVRFLTERYAATHYNDRRRPEWPPHPARVFSALVAALYDDPEHGEAERAALDWLAAAGAPDVIASGAGPRQQSEVYVPTNDPKALASIDKQIESLAAAASGLEGAEGKARAKAEKALVKAEEAATKRSLASAAADGKGTPKNAEELLPAGRSRQPRTFPVALPFDSVVSLRWPSPAPTGVADALDHVASRVARLGHSSSLVSMRVAPGEIELGERTRWVPDPGGDQMLRVPLPGQLERLDAAHARHLQVEARMLPAGFVAYRDAAQRAAERSPSPTSWFDANGWLVFDVVAPPDGGRRRLLDLSLAQHVARAFRGALQAAADGAEWPEVLSGHAPGGGPAQRPHLAIVPLADVGHGYASGSVLGVALVPPREISAADRLVLLDAVRRAEEASPHWDAEASEPPALRLTLGRAGVVHLRRLLDASPRQTLQASRWAGPARRWTSASAVALGRNPGYLESRDPDVVARAVAQAEETVAAACVNIGLPAPSAVWIRPRSLLTGAPAARRFMPFPTRGRGPRRVCVHVELLFAEPVSGPVILGAGRYLGLGLCLPMEER